MNELPICPESGPPVGCCLLQVPDTSSWQVVCASQSGPAAVPGLSEWGGLLLGLLLVLVAVRKVRP